ncbi:MAG TPA: type II toxin-antitoxin system HicB family antitoxin [Acidimicrobiales bacterium]|nr:type II toxin-antitoxin system HicB family antitoxin [Acidimicrobiales bacterium]
MDETMTKPRTFNVRYTPDDNGQWLVEVLSSPDSEPIGVYTHGRTLSKAEANAREALAAWFDTSDEESFVLVPTINLEPRLISKAVEAKRRREAVRNEEAEAAKLTAEAVSGLARKGLSTRDIAYIVGISYQRVQQLLAAS